MKLYGKGYVIEHCISLFQKYQEEKAYRIYVTDCLKTIVENTTHHVSIQGVVDMGSTINKRWIDIIDYDNDKEKKKEKFEQISAVEYAAGIWERAKKKGGKK